LKKKEEKNLTVGLAESNDSLPLGGWLIVTCRLTWAQRSVTNMGSLYLLP